MESLHRRRCLEPEIKGHRPGCPSFWLNDDSRCASPAKIDCACNRPLPAYITGEYASPVEWIATPTWPSLTEHLSRAVLAGADAPSVVGELPAPLRPDGFAQSAVDAAKAVLLSKVERKR